MSMKMNPRTFVFSGLALLILSLPMAASSQSAVKDDGYGNAASVDSYINKVTFRPTATPGELEVSQAKAIDECGAIMINPHYVRLETARIHSTHGKFSQFRLQALQQLQARCQKFAFSTRLDPADSMKLYNQAANKSNPEAIAHNLAWGNYIKKLPLSSQKSKTLYVINSGSPAALFALSPVLGEHGPFTLTPGGEIGTSASSMAWQLVACDRGLNCSANSPVVQSACLSLGICGQGDYRENLKFSGVSPATYEYVTQVELRINKALADHGVQALLNN